MYCWLLLQIYLCYLWLLLCSRVIFVLQMQRLFLVKKHGNVKRVFSFCSHVKIIFMSIYSVDLFVCNQLRSQCNIFSPSRVNLFQELLFRRTNITPSHQDFLYEGRRLVLDPNRQAQTFPKTSRENPIMLLSRDPINTIGLLFEDRESDHAHSHATFTNN